MHGDAVIHSAVRRIETLQSWLLITHTALQQVVVTALIAAIVSLLDASAIGTNFAAVNGYDLEPKKARHAGSGSGFYSVSVEVLPIWRLLPALGFGGSAACGRGMQ